MRQKRRPETVTFRIDEVGFELLEAESRVRQLSLGQTARALVLESLYGIGPKQASLLAEIDDLKEMIGLVLDTASIAAGSSALPLDAENHDQDELRIKLQKHFKNSRGLGRNVLDLVKAGKL